MGLLILGRVVTLFFPGSKYNLMHFEKLFKMHKIIYFFPENLKKILVFTKNLGRVGLP